MKQNIKIKNIEAVGSNGIYVPKLPIKTPSYNEFSL